MSGTHMLLVEGAGRSTCTCILNYLLHYTPPETCSLLQIHTQEFFSVKPYMSHQPDITAAMRTILVDWLVEVQENFELFHETLYMAVKLVDLYLMRREVKREYLQLVGATAMLIAAKFEVRNCGTNIRLQLDQPCFQDFCLALLYCLKSC